MVGVPHSTGCSLCRERRIKCDEAVPQCSQCRKYGRPCPGYRRTFRFQDEGPALQRRHQSRSQSRRRPETTTDAAAAAAAAVRNNAIAMMRQTRSEDPSSAAQTQTCLHQMQLQMQMQLQQPHLFASFLHSAFPTLYTSNLFRAHNRPDFLAHVASSYASGAAPTSPPPSPVSHPSTPRSSPPIQRSTPGAAASSTIMMLAVYEMYARTSPDAFVVHVDGVRRIMLARGPGLHFTDDNDDQQQQHTPTSATSEQPPATAGASAEGPGFARGCYIAFRGFLVATAIYEGRACFLDEDEWLRFAGRIRAEDVRKAGRDARVVDVCERIWMEVVRCPRYFAEALPEGENHPVEGEGEEVDEGLVARWSRGYWPRAPPAGAEDMVAALQSLLVWLRVGRRRQGGFRVVSDFQRGVSSASSEALPVTWLDRVASSMGVIGLRIIWGG
ncbi:Zn(II)2Cys6 transcription factor domain-containing protein [Aspergillus novofumigatus IBT 16806]|uniref:Zn(2)-C6 fungal-type domain-containing protein n=1 Tax=Aspergillus novofumigatus (strain IBT 16806) TaxID=1392255 RepID=A0A2I1CL78_ASPN1|nr:uncharacterized protein P174DRAFT_416118 [Aspergillus novofumigatus IBT 16806]PKX98378.1 hypothetical protein P174DRAFT_416118 [Aspergillus novofumigatus IBT 16806]